MNAFHLLPGCRLERLRQIEPSLLQVQASGVREGARCPVCGVWSEADHDRAGRAGVLQLAGHARAAVAAGMTVAVDGLYPPRQLRVGLGAWCRTPRTRRVVTANCFCVPRNSAGCAGTRPTRLFHRLGCGQPRKLQPQGSSGCEYAITLCSAGSRTIILTYEPLRFAKSDR